MKKFFLLAVVLVLVVIVNTGCMTDHAYVRTTYIHERAYYNDSFPVYGPVRVQTIHVGASTRGRIEYYDSRNNYQNHNQNYNNRYNRGYNNGSSVYVTPAPSAWSLQNMIPR